MNHEYHHQGRIYLELFVKKIAGIDIPQDTTSIIVEANKINKRYDGTQDDPLTRVRVDLTIELGNIVIFLEHKINAGDSEKQLEKYFMLGNAIKDGRIFEMLYLHPTRKRVGNELTYGDSKEEIHKILKFVNYKNMYDWIISCRENTNSERLRMFIDAFLNYLREEGNIIDNEISPNDPYYQLMQLKNIERRLFGQFRLNSMKNDFSRFREGEFLKLEHVRGWYFNQFKTIFDELEDKIGIHDRYKIVNQFSVPEYYYPKFMLIPPGEKYTLQIEISRNFNNPKNVNSKVAIIIGFAVDNNWVEDNRSEGIQMAKNIREQISDYYNLDFKTNMYWIFFLRKPPKLAWMDDICSYDGMQNLSQNSELLYTMLKTLIEIENKLHVIM